MINKWIFIAMYVVLSFLIFSYLNKFLISCPIPFSLLCCSLTPTLVSPQLQSRFFFLTFIIVVSCSALPFGVTTETLATQDPEAEDEETDTPIYEKYDAMLHGKRKDRK